MELTKIVKNLFSKAAVGVKSIGAVSALTKNYAAAGFSTWKSSDGRIGVNLNWSPSNDAYDGIGEQRKVIEIVRKTAEKYSLAPKFTRPLFQAGGVYVIYVKMDAKTA